MQKHLFFKLFFGAFLFFIGVQSLQSQLIERPNNAALVPHNFGLSSQSNDIVVSPADRFLILNDQEQIVIVDTANFALATPQPAPLDSRTESYDFLPNSVSLFAQQSNGMITRLLADDPLNDLLNVDVSGSIGTGVANLVVDPESIDNQLFLLTFSDETIYQYNIATQAIGNSVIIVSDITVTSNNMTYIFFPTTNGQGGEIDRIAVTTNQGRVIFYDESLNLLQTTVLINVDADCPSGAGNPDSNILPAAAVNTIRDLIFILNATDNVVHVVDTITMTELAESPICLHQIAPGIDRDINNNIRDITLRLVDEPLNAPRAFVTGDLGVTLLNASRGDLGVIDAFDTEGDDSANIESIPLSATPNKITASSQADGYIYTSNTDNSVSIISDNPFVTIKSANPDTVTDAAPTFTLTFEVDELCDGCAYRLRANGDINESGTLILETAYTGADMVNTDLVTPVVDINALAAGVFIEGENQVFLFSEDASGNVGRDSISITIDTPPSDVEIVSVAFGNERGFVTIRRLTAEDLKQYNIFVLEAEDQVNPVCPGNLDFTAASPTATVAQPSGGTNIEITISGLTNGVAYCVGVQAEDNGGNVSANIVVAAEAIIPEVTVGITGFAGETGCRLQAGPATANASVWILLLGINVVLLFSFHRTLRRFIGRSLLVLILFASMSSWLPAAHAIEATDQSWAAQFQGGFYLPKTGNVGRFLDACCNPTFQFTFGRIWKSRYEVNLGVGFMSKGGNAIGVNTGRVSGERFNFTVVPISNSFVYHADFVENQLFVPYVSVGIDYLYFRENLQGNVTQGFKFGYHAAGGVQILMEWFDSSADAMEEFGINDVYLTLEGKWQQIDNFGGGGLAFNGLTFSAGLLFLF